MAADDPVAWAAKMLVAAGIENPRFEAQLLLGHVVDAARARILAGLYDPLGSVAWDLFREIVARRAAHTPLAYLRGTQEFYGLTFEVSPAVLIPRPETELLVDFALERLEPARFRDVSHVVDVGTGSGCIAISVAVQVPGAHVVGVDISAAALAVARNNAAANQVADRVRLVRASALRSTRFAGADLILSNPPYVAAQDIPGLQPEIRLFEPMTALEAGEDGLSIVRTIVESAPTALRSGGWIAVEIGRGQATTTTYLFDRAGLRDVEVRRDLAGIDRVVAGRAP